MAPSIYCILKISIKLRRSLDTSTVLRATPPEGREVLPLLAEIYLKKINTFKLVWGYILWNVSYSTLCKMLSLTLNSTKVTR